jgi:hypothetical protein
MDDVRRAAQQRRGPTQPTRADRCQIRVRFLRKLGELQSIATEAGGGGPRISISFAVSDRVRSTVQASGLGNTTRTMPGS